MRAAADHLKAFIERIERLEEEKKAIADDIRDVYGEAKGNGFDVKALRRIIKLRKLSEDERKEQEAILETYMQAIGMLHGPAPDADALDRKRAEFARGKEPAKPAKRAAPPADPKAPVDEEHHAPAVDEELYEAPRPPRDTPDSVVKRVADRAEASSRAKREAELARGKEPSPPKPRPQPAAQRPAIVRSPAPISSLSAGDTRPRPGGGPTPAAASPCDPGGADFTRKPP